MVIAAETGEAAFAKWEHYKAGADTNVRQMTDATSPSAVNINMGTLVGSFASVARMLDEMAEVPDTEGVLLTFDDFVQGVEDFGQRIQPLMKSRAGVDTPVASQAA